MSMRSVHATSRVLTTERSSPCAQPDMEGWLRFASHAEEAGIESVLLSFSRYEPDTLMIACALGRVTRKLKFIVAYRSGLMQPTTDERIVDVPSFLPAQASVIRQMVAAGR